jgi:hypothetical protein
VGPHWELSDDLANCLDRFVRWATQEAAHEWNPFADMVHRALQATGRIHGEHRISHGLYLVRLVLGELGEAASSGHST